MTETTTGDHPFTTPSLGEKNWYSVWRTFAQQLSDYLDNLDATQINTLEDSNDNEIVTFSGVASAVNYLAVSNAATGNDPTITAAGDDTDIGLTLSGKGSGSVTLGPLVLPSSDGTNGQVIRTDGAGTLSFVTANSELVNDTTPQLGGNLDPQSFECDGDWIPDADSTYDLGSASKYWSTLYVDAINVQNGGTVGNGTDSFDIDCGTGGDVTCDVITANSLNFGDENLSNYDEGTFTPTITGGTSGGLGTYTTQQGVYTRIGDMVFIQVYLVWTNHTGSGNFEVASLPFSVEDNGGGAVDNFNGSVLCQNLDWPSTTYTSICAWSDSANNVIRLGTSADNASLGGVQIDTAGSLWFSIAYKTGDA